MIGRYWVAECDVRGLGCEVQAPLVDGKATLSEAMRTLEITGWRLANQVMHCPPCAMAVRRANGVHEPSDDEVYV